MIKRFLSQSTFSKHIAYPSLAVLIGLSVLCAFAPEWTDRQLTSMQGFVYDHFSWVYTLLISLFFIFLLFLACSKYGNIKLGADNSTPQYSFFSWIAMLFAAGVGIGLMYFGVAEPMSHYVNPSLPTIENPAKEAQLATFFHWGIHAWSIFALMGLILAYFSFRYKLPLAIRSGFYPLLGERINGWMGHAIEIFALVSTFFGIATSLGFGVVQLNAGLVHLGLLEGSSFLFQSIIVICVSSLAIFSAIAGVSKGVKMLSEVNLLMAILLMLFILFLGPTTYLLSAFSEGFGYYIGQFARLTFNTFAFEGDGKAWFTDWTVMYWAWWISWSPFVGLFIASISKGRTIREYIAAVLLVPSIFIFLWMTVFGNGAIYIDKYIANGALSQLVGNPDILLFSFFEQFPFSTLITVLALIMIAVFFITSADSGILVINSISTGGKSNSPKWQKVFWGMLLVAISISMLYAGGLKALQAMTLISALPFGIILLTLCGGLLKALKVDDLYHSSKLPYGSRNWDGSRWKERLDQILTFSQKVDVQKFLTQEVRPAFEELKEALAQRNITAQIHTGRRGDMSIELQIGYDNVRDFRYGVSAEKRYISGYFMDE